nr:DUF1413 domain-containing protein [Lachnospiraceae bacterium]
MNYNLWYAEAKKAIENLISVGQVFEVKDLFRGSKWNELSSGEKKSFGRYFSSQYNDGYLPMIKRIDEGKTHHNRYQKVC